MLNNIYLVTYFETQTTLHISKWSKIFLASVKFIFFICVSLLIKKLVLTGFVLGNITFLVYKACICDAKMEINSVFLSTVSNKTNTFFLKTFYNESSNSDYKIVFK